MKNKIAMVSLMGGQPQRKSSHNAGYTFMIRELLRSRGYEVSLVHQRDYSELNNYDAICINNGANFSTDAWNFIGGAPDSLEAFLLKLIGFNGEIFTFHENISLENLVNARKEVAHLRERFVWPEVTVLNPIEKSDNIIIGDSHIISIYQPGSGISKNDGKTLYGALRNDGEYIVDKISQGGAKAKKLHLYFGNIDIRFHLMREENPSYATVELANRYVDVARRIQTGFNMEVTLQCLIPIECETRKIPGTGMYKGKAYNGSQEERQELVNLFNRVLLKESKASFLDVQEWSLGDKLSFEDMEGTRSVHLRPSSYFYSGFKDKYLEL